MPRPLADSAALCRLQVIRREIIANRQLTHANILRLIGVFNEESPRPIMSVVTPWMANGVALTYLELHPVELLHIVSPPAYRWQVVAHPHGGVDPGCC